MSTTLLNKDTVTRKWYVLDAAGKPMGKTAALAALRSCPSACRLHPERTTCG